MVSRVKELNLWGLQWDFVFLKLISSNDIFPITSRVTPVIYSNNKHFFESDQGSLQGLLSTWDLLIS